VKGIQCASSQAGSVRGAALACWASDMFIGKFQCEGGMMG